MEKRYLTTSITYVNAPPHIGHALEAVQTDALARWCRLNGHPTWFLTGTDEHGAKVAKIAADEGVEPKVIADRNSALCAAFKPLLNLSNDDFIRTSDQVRHWPGAQKLWRQLVAAGDIYKDKYIGFYCVGCEAFVTEKDLVDGKCPYHKSEPERIEEENYFFRLSKYAGQIAEKIKTKELEIIPEGRAKETLNVIAELTDISFSRPAAKLPWGIPVPDDPDQTIYVWCDALSNYISAIGYGRDEANFQKWWPADLHCIGKDIMRFHTVIWPGMLLSAGLSLPKKILVHGFITSGGQKMSKSIGNVIDPAEVVETYGIDALRYYLLRELPTTDDGDFSWKRFEELYNHELADNLGNLLSRVVQMVSKFSAGKVPTVTAESVASTDATIQEVQKQLAVLDLQKAMLAINQYISQLNVLVDNKKPWELAETSKQAELETVLYQLLEGLRIVALLIAPFLPETAQKIYTTLGLGNIQTITDWSNQIKWGKLPAGTMINPSPILFPKKA